MKRNSVSVRPLSQCDIERNDAWIVFRVPWVSAEFNGKVSGFADAHASEERMRR